MSTQTDDEWIPDPKPPNTTVREFTEREYNAVATRIDKWLVSEGEHNHRIHIHECMQLTSRGINNLSRKSTSVYPYGHYKVCSRCRWDWRHGRIDYTGDDDE